ncbi:MAG: hypothetical protein ABR548_11235 [Actinomycetota bacterium]|nr:hypothetical protein [Actinomycetota bacterium]
MKRIFVLLPLLASVAGASVFVAHQATSTPRWADHPENFTEGPPKSWSMPFNGHGTEVLSVTQALSQVDFPVVVPKFFSPTHIIVNQDADVIGWSFNLPSFGGWVNLTEGKARMSGDQYQRQFLEAAGHAPDFFTATTVSSGRVPATLAAANGIGRLLWIDAGVQFDITGEGISPQQVAELAESMLYA